MATPMNKNRLQHQLNSIIFGTETVSGRAFDLLLIASILTSVLILLLDSVNIYHLRYGDWFYAAEWFFTLLFTIEYALRLYCAEQPSRYARSFFGVVDLLAIMPTYIALLFPPASYLLIIRLLRVLRIFRILKLFRYLKEANVLMRSAKMAKRKIFIFLFCVMILITLFGSLMFFIEGPRHGFTSIPQSMYWAIVTISTVGYGDITPQTPIGQAIAAMAMLTGYAIIAVPTGILSAELFNEVQRERNSKRCTQCEKYGHETDAIHCKYCGNLLP
jgi:voltage-gated potassium channel